MYRCSIVESCLRKCAIDDVALSSFNLLGLLSKSKSALLTSNLDPFFKLLSTSTTPSTLKCAIPFFFNVISMNTISIAEESLQSVDVFFSSVLKFHADDSDVLQNSCFLLELIKAQFTERFPCTFGICYALKSVLDALSEDFGSVRICIKLLALLHDPVQLFAADIKLGEAVCIHFKSTFLILEENCDGLVMFKLLVLISAYLQCAVTLPKIFEIDASVLKTLLNKYCLSSDLIEDLMLPDDIVEKFPQLCTRIVVDIDQKVFTDEPPIPQFVDQSQAIIPSAADRARIVVDIDQKVFTDEPPIPQFVDQSQAIIPSAAYTDASHISGDFPAISAIESDLATYEFEDSKDTSGVIVEVSEAKLTDMLNLIRFFKDKVLIVAVSHTYSE
jgi:hypothetical protein